MEKSVCGQCGKQYTNKKGVKQHMQRMHNKRANNPSTQTVTLEEEEEEHVDTPKKINLEPTSKNQVIAAKECSTEFIKSIIMPSLTLSEFSYI